MSTEATASASMRLTADVRQALLYRNDGFTTTTSYRSKNSRTTWVYLIRDGVLQVREVGKGAFGGSHFDNTYIAGGPATHRFLRYYLNKLDTSGVADFRSVVAFFARQLLKELRLVGGYELL